MTVKVIRFLDRDPEGLRTRWAAALRSSDPAGAARTASLTKAPAGPGGDAGPVAGAEAVAGATGASPAGRPRRVTVGSPLPGFGDPPYSAVDVQWFADRAAADAGEAWLLAVDPALGAGACRVVAEEVVLRGADYLARRWVEGGERLKMLSFGRRHPDLTPAEFSARWRSEAGRLGGDPIPDDVRGLAYAQNHPVLPAEEEPEWPLDAVNEVWFERLDHLRSRADWFAARPDAVPDFMSAGETWSLFVREAPV